MRREENLDITFASGNRRTDPDPPRPDRGDSKTVLPTVTRKNDSTESRRHDRSFYRRQDGLRITSVAGGRVRVCSSISRSKGYFLSKFSSRLIAKPFPSSQNGSVHKTHIFFFYNTKKVPGTPPPAPIALQQTESVESTVTDGSGNVPGKAY